MYKMPTKNRAKEMADWILAHEALINSTPTVKLVLNAAGDNITAEVVNRRVFKSTKKATAQNGY